MSIVRDSFYIPPEIMMKIKTGEFIRYGSVVRYAYGNEAGQIVSHLTSVNNDGGFFRLIGNKAIQVACNNKKTVIIGGSVFTVLAVGSVAHYVKTKRKSGKIIKFQQCLTKYFEEIGNGGLSLKTVSNLTMSIEKLKKSGEYYIFINLLDSEIYNEISAIVYNFTLFLNEITKCNFVIEEDQYSEIPFQNIQYYLNMQQIMLNVAA